MAGGASCAMWTLSPKGQLPLARDNTCVLGGDTGTSWTGVSEPWWYIQCRQMAVRWVIILCQDPNFSRTSEWGGVGSAAGARWQQSSNLRPAQHWMVVLCPAQWQYCFPPPPQVRQWFPGRGHSAPDPTQQLLAGSAKTCWPETQALGAPPNPTQELGL